MKLYKSIDVPLRQVFWLKRTVFWGKISKQAAAVHACSIGASEVVIAW